MLSHLEQLRGLVNRSTCHRAFRAIDEGSRLVFDGLMDEMKAHINVLSLHMVLSILGQCYMLQVSALHYLARSQVLEGFQTVASACVLHQPTIAGPSIS